MSLCRVILFGSGACLAGDTFVRYIIKNKNGEKQNSKGGTLEHLYNRFHAIPVKGKGYYQRKETIGSSFYVPSINEDNQVTTSRVKDVLQTGIKSVYLVKIAETLFVKATEDHEFFTGEDYIPLKDLNVGDTIYYNPGKANKKKELDTRPNRVEWFVKYHSSCRIKMVDGYKYFRIKRATASYEAKMNGLDLYKYRDILNTASKDYIDSLWHVPEGFHIHHKDGDFTNDHPDNLELLSNSEHQKKHRAEDNCNSCRSVYVKPVKITDIILLGEEMTYDIVCHEPYRNYIANGFVVHNSGKTVSTVTALKHEKIKRLIYLQTERNSFPAIGEGLKIHKLEAEEGDIITCFPVPKEKAFGNLKRALGDFQAETKSSALSGGFKTTQNKDKYGFLMNILSNLEQFSGTDFVSGEEVKLGNVGQLNGEEDVLIIDGLSVLTEEMWKSMVGDKIMISMDDYKPLQKYLADFLEELSKCTNAHVIMLAHEIDKNETVAGPDGKQYQKFIRTEVDTNAGVKNYERLMGKFTDVIHATKIGTKFVWETSKPQVHSIARNLPYAVNLEPDFSKYDFFN
jgi:hypothetical protein